MTRHVTKKVEDGNVHLNIVSDFQPTLYRICSIKGQKR